MTLEEKFAFYKSINSNYEFKDQYEMFTVSQIQKQHDAIRNRMTPHDREIALRIIPVIQKLAPQTNLKLCHRLDKVCQYYGNYGGLKRVLIAFEYLVDHHICNYDLCDLMMGWNDDVDFIRQVLCIYDEIGYYNSRNDTREQLLAELTKQPESKMTDEELYQYLLDLY